MMKVQIKNITKKTQWIKKKAQAHDPSDVSPTVQFQVTKRSLEIQAKDFFAKNT